MAETPADVRRDIELTRERMSTTLDQLEQKLNVTELVRENPWPAIGLAVAAGFILSGSRADVRAAAATVAATRGASSRLGPVLDDLVSQVVSNVSQGFESRITGWVDDIRGAIGTSGQQSDGQNRFAPGSNRFGNTNVQGESGSGYASSGNRGVSQQGIVSQSGSAGITGTPGSSVGSTGSTGFGTGPTHEAPNSFGNAAAGPNPSGPGQTGTRAD
jgi:hypothetical protein